MSTPTFASRMRTLAIRKIFFCVHLCNPRVPYNNFLENNVGLWSNNCWCNTCKCPKQQNVWSKNVWPLDVILATENNLGESSLKKSLLTWILWFKQKICKFFYPRYDFWQKCDFHEKRPEMTKNGRNPKFFCGLKPSWTKLFWVPRTSCWQ